MDRTTIANRFEALEMAEKFFSVPTQSKRGWAFHVGFQDEGEYTRFDIILVARESAMECRAVWVAHRALIVLGWSNRAAQMALQMAGTHGVHRTPQALVDFAMDAFASTPN